MFKNCIQLKTCDECSKGIGQFNCLWCPVLKRCSDTFDRFRQEWFESSCPTNFTNKNNLICKTDKSIYDQFKLDKNTFDSLNSVSTYNEPDYFKSVMIGLFTTIVISMIVTFLAWIMYAYRHPTSPSGIWIIENRPRRLFDLLMTNLSNKREEFSTNNEQTPVA
jgi:hypothetical protein